jgi:hypothetical protein
VGTMTSWSSAGPTVGIAIAAGKVYVGVVDGSGVPRLDDPARRLEVAEHTDRAEALREFGERFRQELRRLKPSALVVMQPQPRQSGWPYAEAFRRVSIETVIMVVSAEERIPFTAAKPGQTLKTLGLPVEETAKALEERIGGKDTYWTQRWPAFAAALAKAAIND